MSDGVTSIGAYSFSGCPLVGKFHSDKATELVVPESCQSIGSHAFEGMALITSVVVPDDVESIGDSAFKGFGSLESITLPFVGGKDGASDYTSVLGYVFGYDKFSGDYTGTYDTTFINRKYGSGVAGATWQYTMSTNNYYYSYYYYIPATLKEVTVTTDTTIPAAAFNGCTMLEKIHLTNCIESVGDCAFQNCPATVDYLISPSKSRPWDGSTSTVSYHGGNGTSSDPYQIFFAQEFLYFLNQIRNGETYEGVYFVLTSNINLGGYAIDPTSLTEKTMFKGVLDGKSHKVFNFTINATNNTYNGFFEYMGGTFKNIGFETSLDITNSLTTDVYTGLLIGNLSGTLENVYVSGSLTATSLRTSYVGGMVGYSTGTILNSYSNVTVSSTSTNLKSYAGGLVGYNDGSITGSFAYGDVSAKGYADSFSFASGLVACEGTNSIVTSCFRYKDQKITKFDSISTSYNELGTLASLEDIISYCKENWDGNVWSFKKTLPSL